MKRLITILAAALLAACASAPPAPAPGLRPNTSPGSARVLLVSFDGAGFDALAGYRAAGTLGDQGYQYLVRHGVSGRSVPIDPTLTAATHASIVTGAPADVHGIVSNSFRAPGTPLTEWASGYSATITADTLWEAAKRQGKSVGVILYPGVDGRDERRSGDWGLSWPSSVGRSRLQTLKRSDFSAEWLPPGWTATPSGSFSPILHARSEWSFTLADADVKREVIFSAFDTSNDGRENYDRIEVRSGQQQIQMQDGWFPLSAEATEKGETYLVGSWSKLLSFDDQLASVTIYWGAAGRSLGYPADYRAMIDREAGFWPSPPDERLVSDWLSGKGGISPEIFIEQANRLSSFITRATVLSMQRKPWDLVLAYQPTIDETEHQFHIENPQQAVYTPANVEAGRRARAAAFQAMDRSIQQLLSSIDLASTAMVVTSDHGHESLDTQVAMNRLLADWGYATIAEDRLSPQSQWGAVTSGHLAHIYYAGSTPVDAADLVRRLRELTTPEGDPVFERVVEAGPQAHPNSGRIVATAYPRFYMSGSARAPVFSKTNHYGQHGGLNTHPGFHAIFAAAGARVVPGSAGSFSQLEIARYVSSLLGIQPPANAR